MKRLKELQRKLNRIKDERFLMRMLFSDPTFSKLIVSLNVHDQLYDKGIDSMGRSLGDYSLATITGTKNFKGKIAKGQPYDHVTLKDSGDFYESFRAKLVGTNIIITAQTIKENTDLLKVWGDDIIGLTDDNLQVVINRAREILNIKIREYLFKS